MNEEEKFDELLSSKLSERDFPFDELNWDEAERLIIQQERRKRITRFTIIFAGGLAAGILIMLPFITGSHSAISNPIVTTRTTNQNNVVQNATSPTINNSKIVATNTTTIKEEKAPLPVQSAFVKKETRAGTRSKSVRVASISEPSKKHSVPLIAGIPKSHHRNKLTANPDLIASATKRNKKPAHTKTITNKETTNTVAFQPANNGIPEKKSIPQNTGSPDKESSTTSSVNNNSIATTPANKTDSNNTTQANKTIALNTPVANVKNTTATKITSPTKKDTSNATIPNDIPKFLPGDYSHNILSVYAGGNYSLGWNSNGDKQANGITPWGGFDFTHYFTPDISASLGLGYSELTGLNKTYTSNVLQYDFGATSSVTTVTPQNVYYIAFPLKLQYNWDKKDVLSIGLDYLLLLTTYSTLTTYQQTYFSQTAATSVKQNGYTQGFSNSDIQLAFAYKRMFTDRLGLSLELYHDLSNVENNTVSGLSQSTKNTGFRLVLSYQLMK